MFNPEISTTVSWPFYRAVAGGGDGVYRGRRAEGSFPGWAPRFGNVAEGPIISSGISTDVLLRAGEGAGSAGSSETSTLRCRAALPAADKGGLSRQIEPTYRGMKAAWRRTHTHRVLCTEAVVEALVIRTSSEEKGGEWE